LGFAIDTAAEILKQPLQTSVSVHTTDFDEFKVQERMHIIISVKDFKAIVSHAATLDTSITAYYSQPSRPMQFGYGIQGIHCEFTLMTAGDARSVPTSAITHTTSSRATSETTSAANMRNNQTRRAPQLPPPAVPATRSGTRQLRPVGPGMKAAGRKQTETESDSLFVPLEDDQRWEPAEYPAEEENLAWDASANYVGGQKVPYSSKTC